MKIAIDLGNRYVKAVSETGKRVIFRSVVADGQRRAVYTMTGSVSKPEEVLQVSFVEQNRNVYVGKMAERFGLLPEYVFGRGRFATESAEILVWTALGLLAKSGEPIDLAIDFPYSQYPVVEKKFAERLIGQRKELEIVDGQRKNLQIRSVKTFPQGLVAVYALAAEHPEFRNEDGYIAVVDIGGETSDAVVVEISGSEVLVHEEISGTLLHGTRDLTGTIRRTFEARTGEILDADLAERALHKGTLFYDNQTWDFGEEVSKASASLARSLHAQLADLFGRKKNRIRTVFWIGGGAQLLGRDLAGFHPSEVFIKEAQWANAKGCLKAITIGLEQSHSDVPSQPAEPVIESDVHQQPASSNLEPNTIKPAETEPQASSKFTFQQTAAEAGEDMETHRKHDSVDERATETSRVQPMESRDEKSTHHKSTEVQSSPARDIPSRFREGQSAWQ